ncbi:MAG TPA: hypothetical protein VKT73_02415 [Xanthobacteraceae bacterium]|nr:hypothetical protein [Xanthobacteraceae bacterium]
MGIGRRLFLVWLIASAIWLGLVWAYIRAGGWFPGKWEVFYTLRNDVGPPPTGSYGVDTPLPRPLYEIIRSPSAERLPVTFQPRGWQSGSQWEYRLNVGQWEPQGFPDGSKLWLQPALTQADKTYIAEQFWDQRWPRWKMLLGPWLPSAAIPPLGLLFALWALRLAVVAIRNRPQ